MSNLLSLSGRTGRLAYNIQILVLLFLQLAAYVVTTGSMTPSANAHPVASSLIFLTFMILGAPVTIRRLHDLNLDDWVYWTTCLVCFPLLWLDGAGYSRSSVMQSLQLLYALFSTCILVLMSLVLSFKQGKLSSNKYGDSPV